MKIVLANDICALVQTNAAKLGEFIGEGTIDSFVTDPPAGIGFMGKSWDSNKGGREQWIEWLAEIMRGVYRVLKPGAHGLVWAIPKTSHWTATALELAGFEIRDRVSHFFGNGFPKSMNISKVIQRKHGDLDSHSLTEQEYWQGWGTALKPACEDWWLVRKPVEGTIVANVLEHGTGALNIDACRIGTSKSVPASPAKDRIGQLSKGDEKGRKADTSGFDPNVGRWPAHVVFDEAAGAVLDAQVPASKSTKGKPRKGKPGDGYGMTHTGAEHSDSGGPSRFFYCPKPSRKEKDAGLAEAGLAPKTGGEATGRKDGSAGTKNPRAGAGRTGGALNSHPTVKSTTLMQWLIKLITPPGGTVLDPFTGSGSTGVAAIQAGFNFVGTELDVEDEYIPIAKARLEHALKENS